MTTKSWRPKGACDNRRCQANATDEPFEIAPVARFGMMTRPFQFYFCETCTASFYDNLDQDAIMGVKGRPMHQEDVVIELQERIIELEDRIEKLIAENTERTEVYIALWEKHYKMVWPEMGQE